MGDSWVYSNKLGLAPKSETEGPALIKALQKEGLISEQSVTLHYNPYGSKTKPSTLTLGPVTNQSNMITGDWFTHKMTTDSLGAITLKVQKITYND